MRSILRPNPAWVWLLAGAVVIAAAFSILNEWHNETIDQGWEGKAKLRDSGSVLPEVINAPAIAPVSVPGANSTGFTPQTRMGFTSGDQWEPAIAADRYGHVYILYPQYQGVPGCPACFSPTMILQISNDHGLTWSSPTIIYPAGETTGQVDAQIVVDPVDGQTVYAAWLQNGKSDIVVGKSTNFGLTWSMVTADSINSGTDKPILAVRGQNVYVSFDHTQSAYVAASHDGGATFSQIKMNQNAKLGWSLGGGGTVTPNGNVYFSWDGYTQNGGAKGPVNLYLSKSSDGGATWTTNLLDVSTSPPDCSSMNCGWAFLGAAMTMISDSAGNLYTLWNAGSTAAGPERIYFSKSTDGGNTWAAKTDVSTAAQGVEHAFPAIAAAGNGDVRIAWMDTRNAAPGAIDRWNVYYRSSINGGGSWSAESTLSSYVSGYTFIFTNGYRFPFGDYFEMDIDERGTTHAVWGEGYNYDTPGSIWYSQGR
jgi:BNR repeat-like domain